MSDDPLWNELEESVDTDRPRYDPARWGTCSICRRGPTDIIPFAEVQWSLCELCSQRWPAGVGLLRRPSDDLDPGVPALPDEFAEEVAFQAIHSLAVDYADRPLPGISPPAVPVTVTIRQEDSFMPRRIAKQKSFGIDPHRFLQGREHRPLAGLNETDRIAVTDAVLNDLLKFPIGARHPRSHVLIINPYSHSCWSRIREQVIDEENGRTLEQVLRGSDVVGPTVAIQNVVSLLSRLRDRRAELEQELKQLDSIAAAFTQTEATPASA